MEHRRPLVICVVRFKCSSVLGVEDNRLPEKGWDDGPKEEMVKSRNEDDHGNDDDAVVKTEEDKKDHDGNEEMKGDEPPDPCNFPLAALSSDPEGKEFRIAFLKTNPDFKRGRSSHYGWAWPGVIRFLAGLEFLHNVKEDFSEPLDTWAGMNKDLLRTVELVQTLPTLEDGLETTEWALR